MTTPPDALSAEKQMAARGMEKEAREFASGLGSYAAALTRAMRHTSGGRALALLLLVARERRDFPQMPWDELEKQAARMAREENP